MKRRQLCTIDKHVNLIRHFLASWNSLYQYFLKNQNQPAADHALEQINNLQITAWLLLYIDQILNEGRLGLAEEKCRAFLKENPTHTYAMSLLAEIANRLGILMMQNFYLKKQLSSNLTMAT